MSETIGHDARLGLRWLAGARLISAAFSIAATFLAIRLLQPEDFGLAAVATMLVGLISLLNEAGLATALVRAPEISDELIDRTQGLTLIVNVAAYGLLALTAPLAQLFFGFAGLTPVVLVAGLQLLVYGPVAVAAAILQRQMRFPQIASAMVAEGILGGVSTLLLAYFGAGVWALVVGPLVGALVRAILVLGFVGRIPRPRPSLKNMGEAVRFGGTLTLGQLIWAAYSRADTVIVGRVLGNQALGLYSVALQVATLPMEKVAGILNTVGLSAFAGVQRNHELLREKYQWVVRTAAGIAFPLFWGISAIAEEITSVVLGPTWSAAAVPLMLISLPVPLRFLSTINDPVLLALGRADLSTKNVIAASVIMIPAFILGSRWGLHGVSMAWVLGYSIFFVYRTAVAVKAIGVSNRSYWRSISPSLTAAGCMFLAVTSARPMIVATGASPVTAITILIATGVLVYLAATVAWNRRLLGDILMLRG